VVGWDPQADAGRERGEERAAMILMVKHTVRNFDTWKPAFEEHQSVRERYGASGHLVYRSASDPNRVTVLTQFPSEQMAKAFMEDPTLRQVMQSAGVEGEPDISMWEEAEAIDYRTRTAA
jgi:hypothetical protein